MHKALDSIPGLRPSYVVLLFHKMAWDFLNAFDTTLKQLLIFLDPENAHEIPPESSWGSLKPYAHFVYQLQSL